MTDNRFGEMMAEASFPAPASGFLMIPVAAPENVSASPLQWLYQRLYEQAAQINQQPTTRDLFAIMN